MRNLVFAGIGLILILVVVFALRSNQTNSGNLSLSSPPLNPSPSSEINLENKILGKDMKKTYSNPPPVLSVGEIKGKKARISTNKGDIVFELLGDSPMASSNFIFLVKEKFYDGTIFHRVIKGFMLQGGDQEGSGRGGPGYSFDDELDPETVSYKGGYMRGVVAMANAGPNTNGSQFFIMHQNYNLPHSYTIFGNVLSGLEVIDAIANSETDENDKPIQPVVMEKVTIE